MAYKPDVILKEKLDDDFKREQEVAMIDLINTIKKYREGIVLLGLDKINRALKEALGDDYVFLLDEKE